MFQKLPEKIILCEQQNTLVFHQIESISFMYSRASYYSSIVLLAFQYNKQLHFSMNMNSNTNYVISKCIFN